MIASGLSRVSALHVARREPLEDSLDTDDIDVLRIDGSDVVDAASLFARFAADLGIPVEQRPHGWDGLFDRLRGVLAAQNAPHVVLLWEHADRLAYSSLNDLVMAVMVLSDLSRAVATTATGFPRELRFSTVLLGDDPAFELAD